MPAAELWIVGRLVDHVAALIPHNEAARGVVGALAPVLPWIAFLIGIRLLAQAAEYVGEYAETALQEGMIYHIQTELLAKAARRVPRRLSFRNESWIKGLITFP